MTSRLVVIPMRRAHSNHAEVARSIGVDIIAGRYAEGGRLPGDAELTAMFRRVAAGVARERQDPGGEGAAHHQGAGRHRGARARRLEHVRCRRAGLASRCRHRPALSQRSRRDSPRRRTARRRARGRPPLGGRHRRTASEHGADAGARLPTPLVSPTAILPCIWPSPTPPAICSCARSATSSRRRCAPRSCSARRSKRRTARRCCRGTSALSMRSRAAMPSAASTAAMIEVIHNGLRRHEGAPASSGAAPAATAAIESGEPS